MEKEPKLPLFGRENKKIEEKINGGTEQKEQIDFPENVVVLATHGSSYIPREIRKKLDDDFKKGIEIDQEYKDGEKKQKGYLRMVKNFSDWGSRQLLRGLPEDQKVVAWFSRAIGDPARAKDNEGLFRDKDFNEVPVWKDELSEEEKDNLIKHYYDEFHEKVQETITQTEEKNLNKQIVVFDVHDTGKEMLKPDCKEDSIRDFPPMILSTQDGEACDPKILIFFAKKIKEYLNIEPELNTKYKGGHITQKYGQKYNADLPDEKKFKRNVIQVEIDRSFYMNETTQALNNGSKNLDELRVGLQKAMADTGDMLLNEKL